MQHTNRATAPCNTLSVATVLPVGPGDWRQRRMWRSGHLRCPPTVVRLKSAPKLAKGFRRAKSWESEVCVLEVRSLGRSFSRSLERSFWRSFWQTFAGTCRAERTWAKTSAQKSHGSVQQKNAENSGKNFVTRFCRGTPGNSEVGKVHLRANSISKSEHQTESQKHKQGPSCHAQ